MKNKYLIKINNKKIHQSTEMLSHDQFNHQVIEKDLRSDMIGKTWKRWTWTTNYYQEPITVVVDSCHITVLI